MFIKRMECENVSIAAVCEEEVVLTINGNMTRLSIDELEQIMKIAESFWNQNNLWQQTSRAKQEMVAYQNERIPSPLPIG